VPGVSQGLRKIITMINLIIGIIAAALIVYLFATMIRPEKF
jgi:K+-transporting ATPase KdpF subunit